MRRTKTRVNLARPNQAGEGKGDDDDQPTIQTTSESLALLGPHACESAKGWGLPEAIRMLQETAPRILAQERNMASKMAPRCGIE